MARTHARPTLLKHSAARVLGPPGQVYIIRGPNYALANHCRLQLLDLPFILTLLGEWGIQWLQASTTGQAGGPHPNYV